MKTVDLLCMYINILGSYYCSRNAVYISTIHFLNMSAPGSPNSGTVRQRKNMSKTFLGSSRRGDEVVWEPAEDLLKRGE